MSKRTSSYSAYSLSSMNSYAAQSKQASTQTLLNALHSSYTSSKPFNLESSTSVVVNAWNSASQHDDRAGPTIDNEIAKRAWEHARRRAEDGCVVLASMHESCPSLLAPFISALPLDVPTIFYTAISAITPFLYCATPQNPERARYSSLAATFTCGLTGKISDAKLKLSASSLDVSKGLLHVPAEAGNRAFDVFYYLLSSAATPAEREALGLSKASEYALLRKSNTFEPAAYLPTADDAASAEVFREALKAIGISGRKRRDLFSVLAGLLRLGDALGLLVNESELEQICEESAVLLGLDPEVLIRHLDDAQREVLVGTIYSALVDWVLDSANKAINTEILTQTRRSSSDSSRQAILTPVMSTDDTVNLTIVDIPEPSLARAVALKTVFDDDFGISAELRNDGVAVPNAAATAVQELQNATSACETGLGIMTGASGLKRQSELEQRNNMLEVLAQAIDEDSFLSRILEFISSQGVGNRGHGFELSAVLESSRIWSQLCLHPTDEAPSGLPTTSAWSAASASRQLRSFMLPEWANRRNKQLDYTADFDHDEFCTRFAPLGCQEGRDGIESFIAERGWSNGEVKLGNERVWVRENAWSNAENMLDLLSQQALSVHDTPGNFYGMEQAANSGYLGSPFGDHAGYESRENLLTHDQVPPPVFRGISHGDYGLGTKGDEIKGYEVEVDSELGDPKKIIEQPLSTSRRIWVGIVWALTFWIPSPLIRYVGGMKRPDVRQAWREKVVLCLIILLLNGIVVFYIIEFGRLLCPQYDKVWNNQQVGYHQGNNDFWVSVHGRVYDITKFWRLQHSSIPAVTVSASQMEPLAGLNLDALFPIPLYVGCAGLVTNQNLILSTNNTDTPSGFIHTFGYNTPYPNTSLASDNWYNASFMSTMQQYYKGDLVTATKKIKQMGVNEQYPWVIINDNVYDFSDYAYTLEIEESSPLFTFIDANLWNIISANYGSDISAQYEKWATTNATATDLNMNCLNNLFYIGKTDIRDTPRCEVQNYILLAFTIILCAVILIKFLAALQLGSKPRPAPQDKFVICQVPAYTEGEEHLRKGLDSLTALQYDNKRKLICVICDGLVTGGGNDRPTSKIVLDILGVDPKVDPPALPFKSVGAGSEQLNYGKVYSGLYEHDGNVVPYLVVVKVGKGSEQSKAKPGNRGKRDSQILLMSFLNRVHHRAPMSPLELEMYHQINNVIGVAPELYEYLFMVDADTMVKEDSLTRLVASCANDAKIVGICGETSLENEEQSWWTMIQVYEYFISHHLAKAFESLFGSVTCLPGCFCMYRLRSADKGKPLIISDNVIRDYADSTVDTLHKKNLLSLGEDRYLTTLMMKHFPNYSFKFVPDAQALTAAPETWSILLSQRRRWINSTIHNLAELIFLKDMCGFCIFSMRFVVFIDLFGTVILPATCAYLVYLIVRVATHSGQFPLISIIMIAGVYGLQAIIFIIKRQWQHVGWMIIYILAYPVYSFILPVFSFWRQDDFSWGQTRVVIGEKGNKQVVALDDEGFDPRSIPLMRWDDYAAANALPGRRADAVPSGMDTNYLQQSGFIGGGAGSVYGNGFGNEKHYPLANVTPYHDDSGYEMDEMRSTYSTVRPASTIMTGLGGRQSMMMKHPDGTGIYQHPASRPASAMMMSQQQQMQPMQMMQQQRPTSYIPNPFAQNRQSAYSALSMPMSMSPSGMMQPPVQQQPYQDYPSALSPPPNRQGQYSHSPSPAGSPQHNPFTHSNGSTPLLHPASGVAASRPASTFGALSVAPSMAPSGYFSNAIASPAAPWQAGSQPSNDDILSAIRSCLAVVDLDTVTKKQLKQMAELKLPTRGEPLSEERRRWLDQAIDNELANM